MTTNEPPNKLEWFIRARSGVDSGQWDWGISRCLLNYSNKVYDYVDYVCQDLAFMSDCLIIGFNKYISECLVHIGPLLLVNLSLAMLMP